MTTINREGRLHAASVDTSERLQRVAAALQGGTPLTTLEIIAFARVCAVNSCIAELRANGFIISCIAVKGQRGVYRYQLLGMVPKEEAA